MSGPEPEIEKMTNFKKFIHSSSYTLVSVAYGRNSVSDLPAAMM